MKTACFFKLPMAKSYAPHLMAYNSQIICFNQCHSLEETLICVVYLVIYHFRTFDRTLKATSPLADTAFNPMSAMSSSLWHKTGRGCFSPSPNLTPIQSAPAETSSLQKESSYSSLQGHADDTNRSHSSHSKHSYSYQTIPDYSEGMISLPYFC